MSAMHLFRSTRSTWCGRDVGTQIPHHRATSDWNQVTCKVCLKADFAEQNKEDEASGCGE